MRPNGRIWLARLVLVLAAMFWSLSGVLVKSPLLAVLPAIVIAGCRAFTAGLCLLPLVIQHWRQIRFRPGLIPMVVCFASMNLLFILALTKTTAAAAIFLQYTATFWASLYGALVLGERISVGSRVALACGLLGIGWIVYHDWNGERFVGNLIALASGLTYAGVVVSLRQLRSESGPWLITLNHFVSGLVLIPWIWDDMSQLSAGQWGALAVMGPIQMALPYVLFAACLRVVDTQEASLILLLEPVLNPLWVWMFWGEAVPWPTWQGGGLILAGLALRYTVFRDRRAPG